MFLEFAGIRRQAGLLDKLRQLFSNQDIRQQHFIRPAFPQDISLLGRISGGDDVGIGRQGTARGHQSLVAGSPEEHVGNRRKNNLRSGKMSMLQRVHAADVGKDAVRKIVSLMHHDVRTRMLF